MMKRPIYILLLLCVSIAPSALCQSASQFANLGIEYVLQENYEGALSSFDLSISLDPYVARVHASRANVLNELGRVQEACQSAKHALELDPAEQLAKGVLKIIGEDNCGQSGGNTYLSTPLVERDPSPSILENITSTLQQASNALSGCDPSISTFECSQQKHEEYMEQSRERLADIEAYAEQQEEAERERQQVAEERREEQAMQNNIQADLRREQERLNQLRNTFVLRAFAGGPDGGLTSLSETCKKDMESCKRELTSLKVSALDQCTRKTRGNVSPQGWKRSEWEKFTECKWSFPTITRMSSPQYGAIARARSSQAWKTSNGKSITPFVWGGATSENPDKSSSRALNRCRVNNGSGCFVEYDWMDGEQ